MDFQKNMARAMRRHHVCRLKAARKGYWGFSRVNSNLGPMTPRQLGIGVATPQVCSCWGCGNPRKWLGERTVQERRLFQGNLRVEL